MPHNTMTDQSRWNEHQVWEHYTRECDKYDMQRLTAVHDIVHGLTTHFQMRNYCPQTIGMLLAFQTFAAHQRVCIVTHIDACNSPFSESACQTLNDLMVTSRRLEYLNLANCCIGPRGIVALKTGLRNIYSCITYLNLSGCQMRDDGGVIVAAALHNNVTCTHLDLGHNLLGSASGRALGAMLKLNECLVDLELGWNSFHEGEECVVPLLKGVRKNCGLKRLGLAWNGMPGESRVIIFIRVMLMFNNTLEWLNLENNRLTSNMDELADGLRKALNIRTVKLGGNPLTPKDISMLFDQLQLDDEPVSTLSELSLGKHQYIDRVQAKVLKELYARNKGQLHVEYAGIMMPKLPVKVIFKKVLMARIRTLKMEPEKARKKRDIGQFFLKLQGVGLKGDAQAEKECTLEEFLRMCRKFGGKKDKRLNEQIAAEWMDKKTKIVKLMEMAAYYLAMYPTILKEKKPKKIKPKPPPEKKKRIQINFPPAIRAK